MSPVSLEPWLSTAEKEQGSWWTHWKRWQMAQGYQETVLPPPVGSDAYPPIEAAPGHFCCKA